MDLKPRASFSRSQPGAKARVGSCDRLEDDVKEHSPFNCWLTTRLTNVPKKPSPGSLAVIFNRLKVRRVGLDRVVLVWVRNGMLWLLTHDSHHPI